MDDRSDVEILHAMGYQQELNRGLGSFSNFALSFSIICILAGGVTSFSLGVCGAGGAAIGLGWPLVALFTMAVAATMAQLSSAFPTSGGLYHWAAILGGRGWGWATAWLNLLGLVAAVAAIDVGGWEFVRGSIGPMVGWATTDSWGLRTLAVAMVMGSQAALNHAGMKLTARLIDLSGWLILGVSACLTLAMLGFAERWDFRRLITFANFGGHAGGDVWPEAGTLRLFALGLLLPAYTLTGFDASAHASEETLDAAREVPRGILRSVAISGLAGWVMLAGVVVSVPSLAEVASTGTRAFPAAMEAVLPRPIAIGLEIGIALAMYGCGLGAVTSASRMAFAFARDGGLPAPVRKVAARTRTPAVAIWVVSLFAWMFTISTQFYSTITAVCVIFLFVSYVLPTVLGALAYQRSWTRMGPFCLGRWFRPLAVISVIGCSGLVVVAVQPPNELSAYLTGGAVAAMIGTWFGIERRRFVGPPRTGDQINP